MGELESKGLLLVFLTAVVSGFSIFVNKFGVTESNAVLFTALKNAVVAVFLFSLLLAFKQFSELRALKKNDWLKLAALGLIGGSIPFALFFTGLQQTSAAGAGFVHKTMFVFVALISFAFLKQRVDKKFLPAAFLLLAGNALLIGLPAAFDYGLALVLLAVLFWACETLYAKWLLEEMAARVVAFGRMFFGSFFLLAFLSATQPSVFTALSFAQIQWIVFTSFFLLAYVSFWFAGLKHLNPVTATIILLLGSPITTALSIAWGFTKITAANAVGVLLLAFGVLLAVGTSNAIKAFKQALKQPAFVRDKK